MRSTCCPQMASPSPFRLLQAGGSGVASAQPGLVDRLIRGEYLSMAGQMLTFERSASKLLGTRVLRNRGFSWPTHHTLSRHPSHDYPCRPGRGVSQPWEDAVAEYRVSACGSSVSPIASGCIVFYA